MVHLALVLFLMGDVLPIRGAYAGVSVANGSESVLGVYGLVGCGCEAAGCRACEPAVRAHHASRDYVYAVAVPRVHHALELCACAAAACVN